MANVNELPKPDHLYHLGLHTGQDLPGTFGCVKAVILMGSPDRARDMASKFANQAHYVLNLMGKNERYHLYKAGPVLFGSHGIGSASLSVMIHEVMKLLVYSGAGAVPVVRVGTSGGVGVEPGTVVLTTNALNGYRCLCHIRPPCQIVPR